MTALRSILFFASFILACGGAPPPEGEAPEPSASEPDPAPSEATAPATDAPAQDPGTSPEGEGGPRTPDECAAQHPELQCRWSVQIAQFFAPCCGNMGSGPVCVCNACETDADCGRGSVCREMRSQQHRSPTTTARVCISRRDPCFHDPPRCAQNEYCAHDGEGHAQCMRIMPAPP
jgi:hypothetical protein